jgi:hypothetical protein
MLLRKHTNLKSKSLSNKHVLTFTSMNGWKTQILEYLKAKTRFASPRRQMHNSYLAKSEFPLT